MPVDRREFLAIGTAGAAGTLLNAGGPASAMPEAPALPVYARSVVVDGCGGPGDYTTERGIPLSARAVQDARDSGVTCVNLTVGPVGNQPDTAAFEGIVRDLAFWERELDAHPDAFVKVKTFADVLAAKSAKRLGLIYGLQDGVAFSGDLGRLDILHALGLRIVQPTYNLRNLLADGCLEPADAGLSKLGLQAIERMDSLRILVDLSHCGRRTSRDAMSASKRPVAFTHTGCAAVADHPRNRTDDELRAVARKGGVAGIYFMPYLRAAGQPMAEDVLRHVEHAVNVAGEDHVGIGTDGTISAVDLTPEYLDAFNKQLAERRTSGIGAPGEAAAVHTFVPDLNTPRRLARLGDLLQSRGHPTARVEKILGGNFARLFKEVWG